MRIIVSNLIIGISFLWPPCPVIGQFAPTSCNNWLQLPASPTSYLTLGDLDVSGTQITIEVEFCRTTPHTVGLQNAGDLVSKHNDPSTVNYLLRPNDAEITTSDGYFQTPPVCDIALNTTYHVAMTYDGSTLKFYRNGQLMSQVAATGTLYQNNYPTEIGFYVGQVYQENFVGYINEVRIWNVARTQADIQANMNTSLPSPTTQPGLLAYYTFGSYQNQQGNASWNGMPQGAPQLNQTNPYCQNVASSSLQGTITGSNTCNNAPGFLTFHSQSGPGPFTITYSAGTQTYTQNNVMDGVPFAPQVQPVVPTTYTLMSIQDPANCMASFAGPGSTTTINPGNCTLCTGALGDPVIDVTFGSGTGNAPPLETAVPGASTTLTFVPVNGSPPEPTPSDGQYSICNAVPNNDFGPSWYTGGKDHTGNVNGYMLFENPGIVTGEFFRQKVSGLCASTKYEFAAWIANADDPRALTAVLPDLTFIVQTEDGTVLDTYNSGPVPQQTSWVWKQYGFLFTLPPGISTVIVRIIDNNPGGDATPGNDFAIDDITFRACGPATTASFSATTSLTQQTVCLGDQTTVYGAVSAGYTSPQYLWQESLDSGKTWSDLPASSSRQLTVTSPAVTRDADIYYRMLSAEGSNIQSPHCRAASNSLILTVRVGLNADFTSNQDVCNVLNYTFSGYVQTGVSYVWNIDGTNYAPTSPTDPKLSITFPDFGSYSVSLKTTLPNGCAGMVTKSVDVRLQPADIISTKDTGICAGKTVQLQTLRALDFCWSPTSYLDNPSSSTPVAGPPVTTKYYFTAKITGANLITNGDFEAGNTAFTSDYAYENSGLPESVYFIGSNPQNWNPGMSPCKDHTSGNGNMLLVNGSPQPNSKVWTETVAVQPNTNYTFSAWLESISNISPAILQFSINGQPLGSPLTANATTCIWDQFYSSWNSGSATSAVIAIVNENQAFTGNDFALDDISFGPVVMQRDSVTIDVETPSVTAVPGDTSACAGVPIPLRAGGSLNYSWSPANGLSDPASADPMILDPAAGSNTDYTVTGTSARGCVATAVATVHIFPRTLSIGLDTLICKGEPAQLYASGGITYSWSPSTSLDNPTSPTPVASPGNTTRFIVTLTDVDQCTEQDSVTVRVKPVSLYHAPADETVCAGFGVILKNANLPGLVYSWSPATGLNDVSAPAPLASPDADIAYSLHISDSLCSAYDSTFTVAVTVIPSPIIKAQKDNDIDCAIHMVQLSASGGLTYSWTPATGLSDPLSSNPMASIDSTTTYTVKGTGPDGCYAFDTLTVKVTATGANTFIVPNAFTPNGDGHNDCFGVVHWGNVQLRQMDIFNRWGQLVFSTRNPADCWDGTFRGQPQPAGGYVFVIQAHTYCGEITRRGVLMLIR